MLSPIHFASLRLSVDFHPHLVSPLRACSPLPARRWLSPSCAGGSSGPRQGRGCRAPDEHIVEQLQSQEKELKKRKACYGMFRLQKPCLSLPCVCASWGALDGEPTEEQQRGSTSCAIGPSDGSQAGEPSLVMEQEVWIHQSCHITLCDATQHGMTDATQR